MKKINSWSYRLLSVVLLSFISVLMFSSRTFAQGNALNFDGIDDHVFIPYDASYDNPSSLSAFAWVKAGTISADQVIAGRESVWRLSTGLSNYYGSLQSGQLSVVTYSSGGISGTEIRVYSSSEAVFDDHDWHFVGFTWNNGDLKLYVDGVEVDVVQSANSSLNSLISNTNDCYIGQLPSASMFNGSIDDVSVWNMALSTTEIRDIMCQELSGTESGLISYYNMNALAGSTLTDMAGVNDGTLQNMNNSDWISSDSYTTWTGSIGAAWNTASNWTNGVPTSNDNAGIYDISSATPQLPSALTIGNVVIGSNSGITINGEFTVSGNLFIGSNVDINGNNLTINPSGKLFEYNGAQLLDSQDAGVISATRTVNNTTEDFGGIGCSITTADNLGSVTVERIHKVFNTSGSQSKTTYNSIKRYYNILPDNQPTKSTSISMKYTELDVTSGGLQLTALGNFNLWNSSNSGSSWNTSSSSDNTTSITTSGVTSLDGMWTAFDPAANTEGEVFPIQLLSFSAECSQGSAEVHWSTGTELNNDYFELQASTDGEHYRTIHTQQGSGNSNDVIDYSATVKVNADDRYIRLKQVDYNGKSETFDPVFLSCNADSNNSLLVYPNPVQDVLNLKFSGHADEKVVVKIYSITGTCVYSTEQYLNGAVLSLPVHEELPAGVYMLSVRWGQQQLIRKLTK